MPTSVTPTVAAPTPMRTLAAAAAPPGPRHRSGAAAGRGAAGTGCRVPARFTVAALAAALGGAGVLGFGFRAVGTEPASPARVPPPAGGTAAGAASPVTIPLVVAASGSPTTPASPAPATTVTVREPVRGTTTGPVPSPTRRPAAELSPPAPAPTAPRRREGPVVSAGGLCVDIDGGVPMNANRIQVVGCNGTAAQWWTAETDASLRVVGYCLRIENDRTTAGTPVECWTCDESPSQRWTFAGDRIVNPGTGLCLTAPGPVGTAWVQLTAQRCDGSANQSWRPPPVS